MSLRNWIINSFPRGIFSWSDYRWFTVPSTDPSTIRFHGVHDFPRDRDISPRPSVTLHRLVTLLRAYSPTIEKRLVLNAGLAYER